MSEKNTLIEQVQEEFPDAEIVNKGAIEVIEGEVVEITPMDLRSMHTIYNKMKRFVQSEMREDTDFGEIPGTGGKPSLYKPGAEKLQRFFGFSVVTELSHAIEQWDIPVGEDEFPLFHYRYTTTVYDANDRLIATCDGACNSYESKYRWRWVPEHQVPSWYDKSRLETQTRTESEFAFAIDKKETEGQYGKPVSYWQSWEKDIQEGLARQIKRKTRAGKELDAWERGGKQYRIPNTDIYSQVNTIMKISQKRSYVGGVIIAANASEYFTQDLEDTENIKEKAVEETKTIRDIVPSQVVAAKELVKYVRSIGIDNPDEWIKSVLQTNGLDFSLDIWNEIIDLVEEIANA